MNACKYACECTRASMRVYVRVNVCVCMYARMYARVCTRAGVRVRVRVQVCVCMHE